MGSITYVIGHKNPDTDSVAAAFALAELRSKLDPRHTYIAARCGNINKQTRFVFKEAGAPIPLLLKDVYPIVRNIMTDKVITAHIDEPILRVFHTVEENGLHSVPVIDDKGQLKGLVGERELMKLFIQETVDKRPIYHFCARHIPAATKGSVIKEGDSEEFDAALMVGAMPQTESLERIEQAGAAHTVLVVGNRERVLRFAVEQNIPAIVITGTKEGEAIKADFSNYTGWVFLSSLDSAETVRRMILATPVKSVMSHSPVVLKEGDYVDRIADAVMSSKQRLLPVVSEGDEEKTLTGVVTRANMLKKHRKRLILVDHNEPDQAVDGIETALVAEIVDHHRLGAVRTQIPISYYAKPVGSTCTLIYQLYKEAGVTPSLPAAKTLMGGIISDTVLLKSPTAVKDDVMALKELSELADTDIQLFGAEIFNATDNLSVRSPESVIATDMKTYSEFGVSVGISQAEVVTLADLTEMRNKLLEELERKRASMNLDWSMLLVTDIIREESILLVTPFEEGEKRLLYRKISPHCFDLPGILSRKKQLLPEILRILEEC